jgi:hypothetical protein
MKKVFILSIALLFIIPAYSQIQQIQSQQVKYTRLDHIQKKTNPFFGKKDAYIEFNLISLQNLMNDSTIYGVEVNLSTKRKKVIATSIALSNLSSLWGSSVSATTRTIKKKGYKFLTYENLETIKNFMNKAIGLRGKGADNYTIYKLTLSDKIQIGLKFDPNIDTDIFSQKLEFIITVEEATYSTSYQDGMAIMQKLNDFRQKLKKLK